jgi:hypothetical protein
MAFLIESSSFLEPSTRGAGALGWAGFVLFYLLDQRHLSNVLMAGQFDAAFERITFLFRQQ